MEESTDEATLMDPTENHRCDVCGEEYKQPLLAETLSGSAVEEYYACSRCLSKIAADGKRHILVEEESATEEQPEETDHVEAEKTEAETGCPHQLGYLKKRDKNAPLPDECLVCAKMINCI